MLDDESARPLLIAGERVGDLVQAKSGLVFYTTRAELKVLSGRLFVSEAEAVKTISRLLRDYQLSA